MSQLYYNFSQTNQTSSPVLLDKTEQRLDSILDRPSDWKMSIAKFSLPANEIETFLIGNSDDYKLTYSFNHNNVAATAYNTDSFSQSMYQSSTYKMKSIQDWIENFNRTSLLCQKGLLAAADTTYDNVRSIAISGTSTNLGSVSSVDLNMDFATGVPTNMFVSYITVSLDVRASTGVGNYEIQLIDPNGMSAIITANMIYPDTNILFEDGSIFNQNSTTTLSNSNYQPLEPFIKFATSSTSQTGIWKIRVINKNVSSTPAFTFLYDITTTLYFSPKDGSVQSSFPRIPLSLNLNGENLELMYDDDVPRCSFNIGVTPRLFELLSFPGEHDGTNYILRLPQTQIANSDSLTIVTYPQPLGCAWKLIDITEVQIRSSNLPVMGEVSATSRERIISSIDLSTSDLNNSNYQYFNGAIRDRSYDLVSDVSMDSINISVFIRYRSTNVIRQVYLPAFTTFNLMLKFFKD